MTVWTGTNKTNHENYILSEDGFAMLAENGNIILSEDSSSSWGSDARSATTWSQPTKTLTPLFLLVESSYSLLIGEGYSLLIESALPSSTWWSPIKN